MVKIKLNFEIRSLKNSLVPTQLVYSSKRKLKIGHGKYYLPSVKQIF